MTVMPGSTALAASQCPTPWHTHAPLVSTAPWVPGPRSRVNPGSTPTSHSRSRAWCAHLAFTVYQKRSLLVSLESVCVLWKLCRLYFWLCFPTLHIKLQTYKRKCALHYLDVLEKDDLINNCYFCIHLSNKKFTEKELLVSNSLLATYYFSH